MVWHPLYPGGCWPRLSWQSGQTASDVCLSMKDSGDELVWKSYREPFRVRDKWIPIQQIVGPSLNANILDTAREVAELPHP